MSEEKGLPKWRAVDSALDKLTKKRAGKLSKIEQYQFLQSEIERTDVMTDLKFRNVFDDFYKTRLRRWAAAHHNSFYQVLAEQVELKRRKGVIAFDAILSRLHSVTGYWEASFASKIFASLYPENAVIDGKVRNYFGLPRWKSNHQDILNFYNLLSQNMNRLLSMPDWPDYEAKFDMKIPAAKNISRMKKLDLMLWKHD